MLERPLATLLPTLTSYMENATPFDRTQFDGRSYEHSHTPCAIISCDYCASFDHDVDTCPQFGRPH